MPRNKLTLGQEVVLTEDINPWYSGYGMNPAVTLPAGTKGVVSHADVPNVRTRGTHSVARFEHEGREWQTDKGFVAA